MEGVVFLFGDWEQWLFHVVSAVWLNRYLVLVASFFLRALLICNDLSQLSSASSGELLRWLVPRWRVFLVAYSNGLDSIVCVAGSDITLCLIICHILIYF